MAIFMKIDDSIKGNVTAEGYKDWIDLESMSFGVSRMINSPTPGVEKDREISVAALSEVQITKKADPTSPQIFFEACTGGAKDSIQIHFCRTGDKVQKYMEITLTNCIHSSYNFESTEGSEAYETISLNFTKIEMKYTPFDDKHKPGNPMDADYDLEKAQK